MAGREDAERQSTVERVAMQAVDSWRPVCEAEVRYVLLAIREHGTR